MPKVFSVLSTGAAIAGLVFPQYAAIAIVVSKFFDTATGWVTRQDNKSSEQVGAGNTGGK